MKREDRKSMRGREIIRKKEQTASRTGEFQRSNSEHEGQRAIRSVGLKQCVFGIHQLNFFGT